MTNVIQSEWKNKWYGIWDRGTNSSKGFPKLNDAIDHSWLPSDKKSLLAYLDAADRVVVYSSTDVPCPLCDRLLPMAYSSDGVWVWNTNLSHLVLAHAVVIPEALVEHIRTLCYVPPKCTIEQIENLPWPEGFKMK